MRRTIFLLAGLLPAAAPPALADSGLAFQYTIQKESQGAVTEASFLKGFEMHEGLRLSVKLGQASYCYVMVSEGQGRFRLSFPGGRPKGPLTADKWARLPKTTFVHVGDNAGVERMYLVIASQRLPELEEPFSQGKSVPESLALDVRDRYLGDSEYARDLEGNRISVRYRSRGVAPAVVVEEISLRRR